MLVIKVDAAASRRESSTNFWLFLPAICVTYSSDATADGSLRQNSITLSAALSCCFFGARPASALDNSLDYLDFDLFYTSLEGDQVGYALTVEHEACHLSFALHRHALVADRLEPIRELARHLDVRKVLMFVLLRLVAAHINNDGIIQVHPLVGASDDQEFVLTDRTEERVQPAVCVIDPVAAPLDRSCALCLPMQSQELLGVEALQFVKESVALVIATKDVDEVAQARAAVAGAWIREGERCRCKPLPALDIVDAYRAQVLCELQRFGAARHEYVFVVKVRQTWRTPRHRWSRELLALDMADMQL